MQRSRETDPLSIRILICHSTLRIFRPAFVSLSSIRTKEAVEIDMYYDFTLLDFVGFRKLFTARGREKRRESENRIVWKLKCFIATVY